MAVTKLVLMLVCLMSVTLQPKDQPKEVKVTPLFSKDLADFPGKEGLMITVEYPPGSTDPIHRHNAHGFIYVLEGSIVMQVRGGKEVTLTPGQTFYEGPDDVHVVGRNASQTKPAKFVVFFAKDKGAPIVVPKSRSRPRTCFATTLRRNDMSTITVKDGIIIFDKDGESGRVVNIFPRLAALFRCMGWPNVRP